jgi:hypothetical protein
MEVTLKIEASQLGETVVDLFKNLGEDQKKAIAIDILTKWLIEPYEIERLANNERVLSEMRANNCEVCVNYNRKRANDCTDNEIKTSSEFKSKICNFKSSREIMINQITNEVTSYFKNSIQEQVKTDEQFDNLRKELYDFIANNFLMMIKEAAVSWFTGNMNFISQQAMSSMSDRMWYENSIASLKQQLKDKYNVHVD